MDNGPRLNTQNHQASSMNTHTRMPTNSITQIMNAVRPILFANCASLPSGSALNSLIVNAASLLSLREWLFNLFHNSK